MPSKKRIFVISFPTPFNQDTFNGWIASDIYTKINEDYHIITITGESDKFECYLVPENIKENE